MSGFEFYDWGYLLLLLLIPAAVLFLRGKGEKFSIRFSHGLVGTERNQTVRLRLQWIIPLLKYTAVGCFVLALARPRQRVEEAKIAGEGIDIVLAIDISKSMQARDMNRRSRLAVVKEVAAGFIQRRTTDRIGIVLFAGEAFGLCPLTFDYALLQEQLRSIESGALEEGTAIGTGILTAVNMIESGTARSRVVILLTDGQNNRGEIDPLTAAFIAGSAGIRVYSIAAGRSNIAKIGNEETPAGPRLARSEIDTTSLKAIARITSGETFMARDVATLENIYEYIGDLEKSKFEIVSHDKYNDLYWLFILAGLIVMLIEIILQQTLFFRIP